jgi:hypothetical protein
MVSNLIGKTRIRFATVWMGVLLAGTLCHAANDCPWLNEATASGLLGGDAVGEFTGGGADQPSECVFTQKDATAVRTLRIRVQVMPDFKTGYQTATQTCGTEVEPMRAIGNEALLCAFDDRKGVLGERVVGRVRDQILTITMTTTLKGDIHLTRPMLKAKISTAAEQVAGNLF